MKTSRSGGDDFAMARMAGGYDSAHDAVRAGANELEGAPAERREPVVVLRAGARILVFRSLQSNDQLVGFRRH